MHCLCTSLLWEKLLNPSVCYGGHLTSIVQHNIVLISKAEYLKNKLQKTHSFAELWNYSDSSTDFVLCLMSRLLHWKTMKTLWVKLTAKSSVSSWKHQESIWLLVPVGLPTYRRMVFKDFPCLWSQTTTCVKPSKYTHDFFKIKLEL